MLEEEENCDLMRMRCDDDIAENRGREELEAEQERFNYRLRPQCIINDSHSLTLNIYHCPDCRLLRIRRFLNHLVAVYLYIIRNTTSLRTFFTRQVGLVAITERKNFSPLENCCWLPDFNPDRFSYLAQNIQNRYFLCSYIEKKIGRR